jgi:hypothetical protein
MDEVVYAVLKHAGGQGPLEQIIEDVEQQPASAAVVHAVMLEATQRSIDRRAARGNVEQGGPE